MGLSWRRDSSIVIKSVQNFKKCCPQQFFSFYHCLVFIIESCISKNTVYLFLNIPCSIHLLFVIVMLCSSHVMITSFYLIFIFISCKIKVNRFGQLSYYLPFYH